MFARLRRPSKVQRSPSDSKLNPNAAPPKQKKNKIQKTSTSKMPSWQNGATPLAQHYMTTTRLNRYYQQFEAAFRTSSQLHNTATSRSDVNRIIGQLASRSNHPEANHVLSRLYDIAQGMRNQKYMGVAYILMLKFETADGIYSIVERSRDRIGRCYSAQKQAYTLTVSQGAHLLQQRGPSQVNTSWDSLLSSSRILESSASSSGFPSDVPAAIHITSSEEREALLRLQEIIEDYTETHKENAFMSSLHEPARFYYDMGGNHHHRDHVDVHGLNGWLCLIRGWFGAQIPIIPQADDGDAFKGCSDVWSGMSSEAWDVFKRDENFGKSYKGLRALKSNMVTNKSFASNFNSGRDTGFVGHNASAMEEGAKKKKKKYLKYAEKFAYFFRRDFLVKKLFEVLNSEEKAEHVGFRKCLQALFPVFYKVEIGAGDVPDYLEFFYDDMLMNLDLAAASRFFWWIGVIKVEYAPPLSTHPSQDEAFFGQADSKPPAKVKKPQPPPGPRPSNMKPSAMRNLPKPPPAAAAAKKVPPCTKCMAQATAPFRFCVGCGDNLEKQRAAAEPEKKRPAKEIKSDNIRRCSCGCIPSPPGNFCHMCGKPQPKTSTVALAPISASAPAPVPDLYDEPDNCCPICMEEKHDIELIPHWHAIGDVSSHKMCGSCRKQYNKNECPFCHEVSIKEEIVVLIDDFITAVGQGTGDPQKSAALVERWQFFEMEFSTNLKVVYRVCKLVLQDKKFAELLAKGVAERQGWIRDGCGLIYRWRALAKDGKLDITSEQQALLEKAYKLSLSMIRSMGAHGHHLGAYYSQCIAVWLSAFQGDDDGETLRKMVKDAGKLVVDTYKRHKTSELRREVTERVVRDYARAFSINVYGREELDPVFTTFYKR